MLNLRLEAIATVLNGLDVTSARSNSETARRGKGSAHWHVEEALQFIDKLDLCVGAFVSTYNEGDARVQLV